MIDFDHLEATARAAAPQHAGVLRWSLRALDERSERLVVRQGIAQPPVLARDAGVMVSVVHRDGGLGYAATSDAGVDGLAAAFARAAALAEASSRHSVFDYAALPPRRERARHHGPRQRPTEAMTLRERIERLAAVCAAAKVDERIVDWSAMLWSIASEQLLLTSDGGRIEQRFHYVVPNIEATAQVNGVTQTRSAAGQYNGFCQQGGLEVLERAGFDDDAPRVGREAIELAMSPPCPSGTMDVVLMPDQMMLQIHESIGHPLELDRILGDERNFAGTSFVTLDMFGSYRYGSELLNVSHDPERAEQFASFGYDDDGTPAARRMLIERGVLKRPLGGAVSVARAQALRPGIEGVATTRAAGWNRAPIDRMSNLNVEPGDATLAQLIESVDDGVLLETNCSWSIDDSRNKFQFGCELGRRIRGGRIVGTVRNPNYRGISATFWRSLAMVGDTSTFEVMGTPYCGKGEPSQVIRVGHAAPACRFTHIDVFGSAG